MIATAPPFGAACGRSSGVERNLAKVEVVGSNPIARSIFSSTYKIFYLSAGCQCAQIVP